MNNLEILARAVVRTAGTEQFAKTLSDLETYLDYLAILRREHDGTIKAACDNYVDEDCEIDDNPLVAESEHGLWVNAWVFVPTYMEAAL